MVVMVGNDEPALAIPGQTGGVAELPRLAALLASDTQYLAPDVEHLDAVIARLADEQPPFRITQDADGMMQFSPRGSLAPQSEEEVEV
jgi:hypothetical protein